jgi:uncharacterized delta-60 repeat protein
MKKFLLLLLLPLTYISSNGQAGNLDSSFGRNGVVRTDFGDGLTYYHGIAIGANAKIVTAGFSGGWNYAFAVTRYQTNGTLDISFSDDGKTTFQFGFDRAIANAVALQEDNKVLVAGYAHNQGQIDFAVARLNDDGSLDSTFSEDGKLLIDLNGDADAAFAIAAQPDGKIVIGGFSKVGPNSHFAVVRLNIDGTPDATFSTDGIVIDELVSGGSAVYALIIQPDNKIIAAGTHSFHLDANSPANANFALAKYHPNGSRDISFGDGGIVTTDFFGEGDGAVTAALQSDGKIVLAGSVTRPGHGTDFGVARYNSDGSPDLSFSGDGKLNLEVGSTSETCSSIQVQSDGKIILAGYGVGIRDNDFVLARLKADGTLDNKFSGDGKLVIDFGAGEDLIEASRIYNDRLYVAGRTANNIAVLAAFRIEQNQPPVAGAWFQKYYSPTSALLAAWGSSDPEGGPITYRWEKTVGPAGSGLLYSNSASPVVTGLVTGTYTFKLTVTDEEDATGITTLTFMVRENLAPIAGTWLQKYYSPTSVLLAAWGSYDPEGGPITYSWQKVAGPGGSTLLYSNSASPVVNGLVNGTYTFRLTVTDSYGATGMSDLVFTVNVVPLSGNRTAERPPAETNISSKENQFLVFPNPVKDILTFRWSDEYRGDVMITVMDMSGRKVKSMHLNKMIESLSGSIELNGLKPGSYHLQVSSGDKNFTKQFVKK